MCASSVSSLPSFSSFGDALARARTRTGLRDGQLGVARTFEKAHYWPAKSAEPTADPHRPLEGMELLVKDLQQVAGEVTTMGSIHQGFVAAHHDSATTRLLAQGARLVGMSASGEYGTAAYTEPVGMDEPVNPLHPGMMVGGSSGGAAVAVARGLVEAAHATDGGGSIRIPAACVGLPGLKPAHQRRLGGNDNAGAGSNSQTGGTFTPVAHGFIAKDLETTAKVYGLEISQDLPRGLRIGYTNAPFHSTGTPASSTTPVDPIIAAATAAATALATGHPNVERVTSAPAPYPPHTFQLFSQLLAARCAALPGYLSELTSWLRTTGRTIPSHNREQLEQQILALNPAGSAHPTHTPPTPAAPWADLDIIATPTIACAPPPPGAFSQLPPALNFAAQTAWTPWGTAYNLLGWASISFPLVDPARVPGRWPISLMFGAVANKVSASQLLGLAAFIRDATSHLPAEQLSIGAPGDISALGFGTRPDNGHHHGAD